MSILPRPRSRRTRPCPAVVVLVVAALTVLATPSTAPALAAPDPVPVGTWPLAPQPEVVRTFDPPENPYGAGHRGVDLLGRPGQTVVAALPGRVSFAGPLAGRGVVVVDHGATRTTYEPVTASVAVGDEVAAGAPLGTLVAAGSHCRPRACLHWGWREGDTYLDPLLLVGAGPVRLVPLDGLARPAEAGVRRPYDGWSPPAARPAVLATWRSAALAVGAALGG
ncbi:MULTISPECIES: M23 family metallopeptidase [unclassified Nocardioides]|uniref:murein hydrolase activator EnvC family protein n=1 Tax=unclassified Nocardioides TaxID=2615069 RepID=UPI0024051486|nr:MULTISPECIES: M23 family metallopeptidase [unclassified Nocardioides]